MNAIGTRRDFLTGAGALIVSASLPGGAQAQLAPVGAALGKPLDAAQVDAFFAFHADGTVTLYSGKVDLGTGLRAAFPQIAAEELGIPLERIHLIEGDTALTPDQGSTSGSTGIARGGVQLRQAAATARQALVHMAAERLKKPEAELDAIDGMVRPVAGGDGISFADLVADKKFALKLDPKAPVRKPETYKYVGKPVRRPDMPAKATGTFFYMQDFERPGMLHGRVIHKFNEALAQASVDQSSVAHIPGVQVVCINNFLGVVAPDEWDAVRAAKALKVTYTHWPNSGTPTTSDAVIEWTRNIAASAGTEVLEKKGVAPDVLAVAKRKTSAEFYWPPQSHGSIGPSCAIAEVGADQATVWCSSQGTHRYAAHFAKMLDLPQNKVRLIYVDGAGCYGMNGHEDAAADAIFLSRAVGKPVRVQWSREDELGFDPKGPPQLLTQEAAIGEDGKILAWRTQMWIPKATSGLPTNPVLAATEAGAPQVPGFGTGSISQGGAPIYDMPHMQVDVHWLKETPLRPSHLRAPGKIGNLLAVETFMDELALMAGRDPVEYRLAHLSNPRGREALQRAAALFGWETRVQPRRDGKGRGVGYTQYKNSETFVAMAMEVSVDQASGRIKVERVACAHDCGQIVSPDGVRSQVEGCILQTISRTLFEEVKFDRQGVVSLDWGSYPIMTFGDVPTLKIDLIDRPNEPPWGAGEAATAPVAAALANAVFDATGVRLRRAPFTMQRVKAALLETATKAG